MKKYFRLIILVLPFVLGTIGLLMKEVPLLDSAFYSVQMYVLNYGDSASNVWIELARWLAPLATASGIAMIISSYSTKVKNYLCRLKGDSVAVYGNDEAAEVIKQLYGNRLITVKENQFEKADKYVLWNGDKENLTFDTKYRDKLKDHSVCMKCTSFSAQDLAGDKLTAVNPAMMSARMFWKEVDLYEYTKNHDFKVNISIIGFDELGQALLLQGLQRNIFAPDQQLTYHIFGDSTDFKHLYHQLDAMEDEINFYDNWRAHTDLLTNSIVIIAEQDDQYKLVHELLFGANPIQLHVLSEEAQCYELLENREKIHLFEMNEHILTEENLFEEALLKKAKEINLRYAHIYSKVEENLENREKEWKKLNSFTKGSNISAADYHEVRLNMMKSWGVSKDTLTVEQLEFLAELEHIRWGRYHYLQNWKYGIPSNGKAKDVKERIHVDLKPYHQLSEEEKEKDRENIRVLLSI